MEFMKTKNQMRGLKSRAKDLAEMQTQPGAEDVIEHLHPNHLLSVWRKSVAKKPKQPNPAVDGAESD